MKKILSIKQEDPEVFKGCNHFLTEMTDEQLAAYLATHGWMIESGLD